MYGQAYGIRMVFMASAFCLPPRDWGHFYFWRWLHIHECALVRVIGNGENLFSLVAGAISSMGTKS